jgi:hypothetical protein
MYVCVHALKMTLHAYVGNDAEPMVGPEVLSREQLLAPFSKSFDTGIHVCMYVCMYERMYVFVCVCMYVCMYVCMHVCMYICI